jgi:hypothetical protein
MCRTLINCSCLTVGVADGHDEAAPSPTGWTSRFARSTLHSSSLTASHRHLAFSHTSVKTVMRERGVRWQRGFENGGPQGARFGGVWHVVAGEGGESRMQIYPILLCFKANKKSLAPALNRGFVGWVGYLATRIQREAGCRSIRAAFQPNTV